MALLATFVTAACLATPSHGQFLSSSLSRSGTGLGRRAVGGPSLSNAAPLDRRPLAMRPLAALPIRGDAPLERTPSVQATAPAMPAPMLSPIMTPQFMAPSANVALGDCPGDVHSKCNYDDEHRVCARFLNDQGEPLTWGQHGPFWSIKNLLPLTWDAGLSVNYRDNGGDSSCINMWLAARVIQVVGCENAHIRCDATDIDFVTKSYWWDDLKWGLGLQNAKQCLQQRCSLGSMPNQAVNLINSPEGDSSRVMGMLAGMTLVGGAFGAVAAVAAALRRRRLSLSAEPLLG